MPIAKRDALQPYWKSECGRATVYLGDCREVMARLEPQCHHAVVTDPPYGLGKEPDPVEVMTSWAKCGHHEVAGGGFMGKSWDAFVPQPATWRECYRTMKPGAHMLCFAGTRTLDWMTMSLRFSGVEIRDLIMWVYGGGYPKGTNVSKAIDKVLGAERTKVQTPFTPNTNKMMEGLGNTRPWKDAAKEVGYHEHASDDPVTDAAQQWQGYNTALKPAVEPIILARKPFAGTVARCVLDNGTGALNVNGCRVEAPNEPVTCDRAPKQYTSSGSGIYNFNSKKVGEASMNGGHYGYRHKEGRYPANLIHDGSEEVVSLFPQSTSSSAVMPLPRTPGDSIGEAHGDTDRSTLRGHDDSGSAARFFYTAKADKDDRPHGKQAVTHPTVKPLDLMRYLVRLVCAPGGVVLDPFMGSGSTGCAAIAEGMWFVGIEQDQAYADLAVGRLKLALATCEKKHISLLEKMECLGVEVRAASPLSPKKFRGS